MEWQVQIYISEISEWLGWAHTDYDPASKKDAERAAKIARRYGWTTRVVRVKAE